MCGVRVQASLQVATMLGHPQSVMAPSQQATTAAISGMSPKQLFKILKELKSQMEADPEKGRAVLRANLSLTKALFQAQILLGMVNPDQPPMGPVGGGTQRGADNPSPVPGGGVQGAHPSVAVKQEPQAASQPILRGDAARAVDPKKFGALR